MDQQTYIVTFGEASAADAHLYAEELRNAILDASPDTIVQRKREHPHTQDFGTNLVLILNTPGFVAAVAAVGNWLKLRNSASITWKTADEQIIVENITSKNAVELAQILLNHQSKSTHIKS